MRQAELAAGQHLLFFFSGPSLKIVYNYGLWGKKTLWGILWI
jgi:hypothetical protein